MTSPSRGHLSPARRDFLMGDYLPKIERCLEKLTDEQIWWRANEESNSIGNLILHLCGNARQWIICGVGSQPDNRNRDSEFEQRDVSLVPICLTLLRSTLAEVRHHSSSSRSRDGPRTSQNPGQRRRDPRSHLSCDRTLLDAHRSDHHVDEDDDLRGSSFL